MNYGTFGFSGKGSGYEILNADVVSRIGNRTIYTFQNTGALVYKKNGRGGLLRVESKLICDILLVGGGGGGMRGGGGGGGVIFLRDYEFQAGEYPIIVGEGGGCGYEDGRGSVMYLNSSGGHSMVGKELIAYGGGRGGTAFSATPTTGSTNVTWDTNRGVDGGSGGGTGGAASYKGLGTEGQGYDGGISLSAGDPWPGGSGGGAGGVGGNASINSGTTVAVISPGGAGKVCDITGTPVTYGGGGGGSAWTRDYYGNGGSGGGGRGGGTSNGRHGTNGLGGGGGGAAQGLFTGSGGSGVVIISCQN